MMNKKAIAAFAAGATLLAGFAMATPAMAEETPVVYVSAAKAKTAAAYEAYTKAQAAADAVTVPAEPKEPTSDTVKAFYEKLGEVYALKADAKGTGPDYEAAKAFVNGMAAHKKAVEDKAAKQTEAARLRDLYLAAVAAEKNAVPDPVEPTLEQKQKKAIAKVYTAKQKVD